MSPLQSLHLSYHLQFYESVSHVIRNFNFSFHLQPRHCYRVTPCSTVLLNPPSQASDSRDQAFPSPVSEYGKNWPPRRISDPFLDGFPEDVPCRPW